MPSHLPKPALSLVPASATRAIDTTPVRPQQKTVEAIYSHALAARAINNFEQALGGREQLILDLLAAPALSDRLQTLLKLALDHAESPKSLAMLCTDAQMLPGEVFLAFKDVMAAKAAIQTMRLATEKIHTIVQEIVQDAVTHEEECPACRGAKSIVQAHGKKLRPTLKRTLEKTLAVQARRKLIPCKECNATGKVLVKGHRGAQKLVLTLAGVLQKLGPTVNVDVTQTNNTQINGSAADQIVSGGLAQLQQAVGNILFGRQVLHPLPADAIDVTPATIEEEAGDPEGSA